jgi:hypothetical protein
MNPSPPPLLSSRVSCCGNEEGSVAACAILPLGLKQWHEFYPQALLKICPLLPHSELHSTYHTITVRTIDMLWQNSGRGNDAMLCGSMEYMFWSGYCTSKGLTWPNTTIQFSPTSRLKKATAPCTVQQLYFCLLRGVYGCAEAWDRSMSSLTQLMPPLTA